LDLGPGTAADLVVVGIIALSALVAFLRGFVREVLTICVWVGALFATLYAFPYLRPYMRDLIANPPFADAAAAIAAFVTAMVVLSLVSHYIAKLVRGSALNAIDRSLGLAFGVLRGAVLVCLGYLLIMWSMGPPAAASRAPSSASSAGETGLPAWVRDARTRPLVAAGAEHLREFAYDVLQKRGLPLGGLDQRIETPVVRPGGTAEPGKAGPGAEPPGRTQGYRERERGEMNRLIETTR
jgi:membrane protein required for colicin V production